MKFKPIPEGCTQQMVDHYWKRTESHIELAKKYAKRIFHLDPPRFRELDLRIGSHDRSKFEEPEYEPYVWLTWRYKCKDDGVEFKGPDGIDEAIDRATLHHILTNRHHPEFHDDTTPHDKMINKKDRDAVPDRVVNATAMDETDIGEMVADWCAMGEERGNTAREWADKTVNKRWKFTPEQKELIYGLIDSVEGEKDA